MANADNEKIREMTLDELPLVVGGTDYSYAYAVIGEMRARFVMLLSEGTLPEKAREIIRQDYWEKLLEVCRMHPDDCGLEKQAQVILMFVIGG